MLFSDASESRDRRDGWAPGTPIRLADDSDWHLPPIDSGLIPGLVRLVDTAETVRRIGESWRATGSLDPDLRPILRGYLVDALTVQYRTDRTTLEALSQGVIADPVRGMIVTRHLLAVRRFATQLGRIGLDGSRDRLEAN